MKHYAPNGYARPTAPPRPPTEDIEQALDVLVTALIEHRKSLPTRLEIIDLRELAATSIADATIDDIVEDPVGHALGGGIREIGEILARRLSLDELLQLAERVSGDLDTTWGGRRFVLIEHCFDGLTTCEGGHWVA